jgi:hypothetical protein
LAQHQITVARPWRRGGMANVALTLPNSREAENEADVMGMVLSH